MPSDALHQDVVRAMGIFEHFGMAFGTPAVEASNLEYGAALASAGPSTVRFRVGKVTPSKAGMFVTVWRRAPGGKTEPYPAEDVDALVVATRQGRRFGAFVFSKAVLVERGIVSANGVGGKRGFRVYPPWTVPTSPQAARSQKWQCSAFLEAGQRAGTDRQQLDRLFGYDPTGRAPDASSE